METDPELIDQFVAEATELLTTAEEGVLALEESGASADPALIDRLFRALHTVKGGAGLLGFTTFARLGHAMEDVVGLLRDGKLQPGAEVTDPLLRGIDKLRTFLGDLQNDAVDISEELQRLEAVLGGGDQGQGETPAAEGAAGGAPEEAPADADALRDFLGDANEQVMVAADTLAALEEAKDADVQSVARELAAALGSIVAGANKCGLTRIADLAGALVALIGLVRDGHSPVDDEMLGAAYAGLDALRMLLFSPEDDEIPISDELENLRELSEKRSPRAEKPTAAPSAPPAPAAPAHDASGDAEAPPPGPAHRVSAPVEAPLKAGGDAQTQSIRIPIALLDRLMNLATELVLVRNQNIQAVQAKDIGELRSISQRLNVVTSDLQATIMQTRMRPVSTVFARFKRVIHDLGRQLGKKIEPVFSGGEVELDKNILEAIADPLLHLVRNAADHGIESPEERIAKDKRPTGRLRIKASHRGDQVHIEVSDDGRGMDADELRKAAVRKGMLTEQEAAELSEREAFSLVFEPGFSTSEVVTDLSGRGVGMDVVKACIQRIGGSAEITSTPGRGTTVTVRLPLTLAIIPALIVRAGDACLAIPQTKIKEVVWLQGPTVADAIQKVDRQEVYWLRGQLLPIVRLENVLKSSFGKEPGDDDGLPVAAFLPEAQDAGQGDNSTVGAEPEDVHIVVVRAGAEQFGLLVNEIVDTEEIVVKGLHPQIKDCEAFAGATVLGDGRIALIVDVAAIAQLSALRFAEGQETVVGQRSPTLEPRTILLFDVGTQELFAIPLCLIIRVEEVPVDRIQTANGREYLEFRGAPIPLIRLEEIVQGLAPRYPEGTLYAIIPKSSRPFGILASRIIDNVEMPPQADLQALKRPGITGSQLIDGRLSLMLDVYGIIETVYPGWLPIEEGLTGKRILIADDSPFSRLLLASYLSGTGLEIEFAADGREALHAIRQKAFDLVISDLEMPRMDGLELAHALTRDRRFASLPLLAVTGLRAGVREAALDAGFWDCKSKSDREGVLEAVLKCCSPDAAVPVKQL